MNPLLYQMNSVTAPAQPQTDPLRQIANYFTLLRNMSGVALSLIWERKYGLNQFAGVLDNAEACAVYDDLVACVMRPEDSDSEYFYPEEIDAIAQTLAGKKMNTAKCIDFIKKQIESRLERLSLEADCDGDTHAPTINWVGDALALESAKL